MRPSNTHPMLKIFQQRRKRTVSFGEDHEGSKVAEQTPFIEQATRIEEDPRT
jgi:hypothetical protein